MPQIASPVIHRSTPTLVSILAALLAAAASLVLAPAFVAPGHDAAHSASWAAGTHSRNARVQGVTKYARFVSNLGDVQRALNQCRGPVAWNSRGEGAPWLLFEHDYCGGAWALSTRSGDRLTIRNGALAGTWQSNGRVRVISRGALVSTTRGLGQLVVQTCIPGTSRMRLVGFDRAR